MRSSHEHSSLGQARDGSAVRRGFARRGRHADRAGAGRICGLVVMGCAVAAAACNNTPHERKRRKNAPRGGAVMPHALINCTTDVGAEAESLATNLIRFCAVHPSQE